MFVRQDDRWRIHSAFDRVVPDEALSTTVCGCGKMSNETDLAIFELAAKVFVNPPQSFATLTSLTDTPGWDSIRFITLLVNIEKKFLIRFLASEATRVKTWTELIALTDLKIQKARRS